MTPITIRITTLLALLFSQFLLWPGIGSADKVTSPDKIVVGFAQDTLANDWRLAQAREIEHELSIHRNIQLLVTDGAGKTAKQISDIEDLIRRKIDILITSPRDSAAMTPVIERAYDSGIPVILLTRGIMSDHYTTLIGADDTEIARDAAIHMAKQLKQHGNILVLQGVPTTSTAIARTNAFVEEIAKYPELKISAIKVGNYLRSDAIQAIEEAMQENLAFDAIYAQSDSMATGARMALKKAGRNPADILIVGIDYINEAREAIRAGEQDASFLYPTAGKQAAIAVHDIINGKKISKRIKVKSTMITRDNVEQINPIF